MYIKWNHRQREYAGQAREPHRTVAVQLVESRRANGQGRHRVIAHLGSIREPITAVQHRLWFYERCDQVLDALVIVSRAVV
jgi:hypothetical protein